MITVAKLLAKKNPDVYTVAPTTTVFDAIQLMSEKNIGAVPVHDGTGLCGIFSERDYARKIVLLNRRSQETPISEIMTVKVFTVAPGASLDDCMTLMSSKKVRHLPVVDNEKLVGIISIGDVVSAIIQSQKDTINHLQQYITQ